MRLGFFFVVSSKVRFKAGLFLNEDKVDPIFEVEFS